MDRFYERCLRALRLRGLRLSLAASVVVLAGATTALAQQPADTVKQIFEKFTLIGTFAFDCSKPPAHNNPYYVDRVLDDNTIQQDRMSGLTTRDSVTFIDRADQVQSNLIGVFGKQDNDLMEGSWRIEPKGVTLLEVKLNGKATVADGKIVGTNNRFPFLNRCSTP